MVLLGHKNVICISLEHSPQRRNIAHLEWNWNPQVVFPSEYTQGRSMSRILNYVLNLVDNIHQLFIQPILILLNLSHYLFDSCSPLNLIDSSI